MKNVAINQIVQPKVLVDLIGWLHTCQCFFDQQAMTATVQQAMQYVDLSPDLETKIALIKTLNSVAAGKVIM